MHQHFHVAGSAESGAFQVKCTTLHLCLPGSLARLEFSVSCPHFFGKPYRRIGQFGRTRR